MTADAPETGFLGWIVKGLVKAVTATADVISGGPQKRDRTRKANASAQEAMAEEARTRQAIAFEEQLNTDRQAWAAQVAARPIERIRIATGPTPSIAPRASSAPYVLAAAGLAALYLVTRR